MTTVVSHEVPNELDYWRKHRIQTAVENVYHQEVIVSSSTVDEDKVTIRIPKENGYISLKDSYFEVKCKVTKAGNKACDHAAASTPDKVGVINNFANSLWKKVTLNINGHPVEQVSLYPYRTYITELLGHEASTVARRMAFIAWNKDTAGKFDKTAKGDGNTGRDARSTAFETSKEVTLICPLHSNLSDDTVLLPAQTEVAIELERSPSKFLLLAADDTIQYEVHITALKMWVQRSIVRNEAMIAHKLKLRESKDNTLSLSMRMMDMKTKSISVGTLKYEDTLFANCPLPDRVFVMFVSKTATLGAYTENPFALKHYGCKSLQLIVNSEAIPRSAYEPDFSKNSYLREYRSLLEELGVHEGNGTVDLTYEEYGNGFTIFPFRLVTRHEKGEVLGVPKQGSIAIKAEFAASLKDQIDVLVLYETRGSITIPEVDQTQ